MIKIPDNVEEWDIGLISKLIHEGYDENEILEFKSTINAETKKIPITACAFANTRGGFIIFGVNNDRTNAITLDQRLVGLEDSDDLKSKIANQLKNIKPDILLSNVQFKESNIKLLNGKVITIMRIMKSNNAPHQFEHKFYKRLSNGNEPMDVEEIRQKIIQSEKNDAMTLLLRQEGGLHKDLFESMSYVLSKNSIASALALSRAESDTNSFRYFLYNQSHFYGIDVQQAVLSIIEYMDKLKAHAKVHESFQTPTDYSKETLLSENVKTVDDLFKKKVSEIVKKALQQIEIIESAVGKMLTPEVSMLSEYKKAIV